MKKHVRLQIAMPTGVRWVKFDRDSITQSRTSVCCRRSNSESNTCNSVWNTIMYCTSIIITMHAINLRWLTKFSTHVIDYVTTAGMLLSNTFLTLKWSMVHTNVWNFKALSSTLTCSKTRTIEALSTVSRALHITNYYFHGFQACVNLRDLKGI